MPDKLLLTDLIRSDNRLNVDQFLRNKEILYAITRLTPEAFDRLSQRFKEQLEQKVQQSECTKAKAPRQRRGGAGRPCSLERAEEKLFFLMFYYRFHPTFDLAGELFNANKTSTWRWLAAWEPVLGEVSRMKLKFRRGPMRSADEFRLSCRGWYSD